MTNRSAFRKRFHGVGPAVTPVIHVQDPAQAIRNTAIAIEAGAAGVFFINHDFPSAEMLPALRAVRARWPALWMGANFLAETGKAAFPVLGRLAAEGCPIDAYWADDGRIDERVSEQIEAAEIAEIRARSGWGGLYLGGVAFKKQRPVAFEDTETAGRIARGWMDVVCTSGDATGIAADDTKIAAMRAGVGDAPLAIASGVTPENVARYAEHVDLILVATGVNRPGDFYNLAPDRLADLLAQTRAIGAAGNASDGEGTGER